MSILNYGKGTIPLSKVKKLDFGEYFCSEQNSRDLLIRHGITPEYPQRTGIRSRPQEYLFLAYWQQLTNTHRTMEQSVCPAPISEVVSVLTISRCNACSGDFHSGNALPFFPKAGAFQEIGIEHSRRLFSPGEIKHDLTGSLADITKQFSRPGDRVGCQNDIL